MVAMGLETWPVTMMAIKKVLGALEAPLIIRSSAVSKIPSKKAFIEPFSLKALISYKRPHP